jgi:hypothetical protein
MHDPSGHSLPFDASRGGQKCRRPHKCSLDAIDEPTAPGSEPSRNALERIQRIELAKRLDEQLESLTLSRRTVVRLKFRIARWLHVPRRGNRPNHAVHEGTCTRLARLCACPIAPPTTCEAVEVLHSGSL